MLYKAFFPYLFLVTGINNRAGFENETNRPDHQGESGELFYYKYTPIFIEIIIDPMHEYKTIKISIFALGINGPYEHAISVVGVFFILITIAVAYIIHRKRSEKGKDKYILQNIY